MNTNIAKMVSEVYSEDRAHELATWVDGTRKNGIVSSSLREYMINAIKASETVLENATWCNAYVVASIVTDENFDKAFKDRTDLAKALNYDKSTISKYLGVVELRDVMFDKGYTGAYTVGQLSELLGRYNRDKKNGLEITPILDFMHFNENMTSKEVRDGIKRYDASLVTVKDQNDQPTNDQPTNDQPTNDQPTNDQPTNDQPTNDQPTNDQNNQPTDESCTDETNDECIILKGADGNDKAVSAEEFEKLVDEACGNVKKATFNIATKNNKKLNLTVEEQQLSGLIRYLLNTGIMKVK